MQPRERICATVLTLIACTAIGGRSSAQEKPDSAPLTQGQQSPAQQAPASSPSPQQAPASDKNKGDQEKDPKNPSSGTSKDRLFFTLPNFLTLENANQVPPLTAEQKFKVVARSSFDYVQYPWYGFLAGISQAENSEPGYGQGAAGYGKRFGAAIADGTLENFMTSAVFPSLLRQDPRFFQSGKGGFWHRTGYAMSRVFVTRTDSGHSQVNYSEIFGSALSAGISTYSYHPHADRTMRNSLSVWGTQVGYDTITYVVKEFWPDIRRKIHKKPHQPDSTN
ncbi:MAG TPA: hypothetical protein VE263_15985 [Candidatus Angelobacter sp.]|nr:hypothetical protein [Candidatus Angelobacter sp.]